MTRARPTRAHSPAGPPVPVAVDGPHGPIRLKWHMLRTERAQAPFRPANLALGWQAGASLEIDVQIAADGRLVVAHDPTLGPATTGRGRVARLPATAMAGLLHRDRAGRPDRQAPLLTLAELAAPLRDDLPRAPGTRLQLDLKLPEGHTPSPAALANATAALAGLEPAIVVSGYVLDQIRAFAGALTGARLGYDPLRAVSRDRALARDPARLLGHLERRAHGLAIVYLHHRLILAAEAQGFPLVARLRDLGLETDAWTLNPGPDLTDGILRTLIAARVGQITTDAPTEIALRVAALQ